MNDHGISVADRLSDLTACIDFLDRAGQLIRVRSEVDPVFELAGIARQLEGTGCVLFERVRGSRFPVLCGLLADRDTVGQLFGFACTAGALCDCRRRQCLEKGSGSLCAAPARSGARQRSHRRCPDLQALPIPQHALKDGGRYLDASLVVARNPR